MAIFDDNILREEEQLGGFNPGEPDDDVFYLGENTYPGDISEFEFKEVEAPVVEESGDILDAAKIGAADMSVWDFFEKDELEETSETPIEEVVDKPNFNDVISEIENVIISTPESSDSFEVDDEELDEDAINALFNPIKESEVEPTKQSADNIEEISVDDDFKKFLQGQIDKRQVRKENEIEEKVEINTEVRENEGEFVPVEKTEDTQLIDITAFEADRPSKMIGLTSNPDNIHEDRHQEKTEIQDEDPDENVENKTKEKKRKKPFPWLFAAVIFAGFLLLGTVGYFLYHNLFMKKTEIAHTETVKPIEKEIAKVEDKNTKEIDKSEEKLVDKPIDTVDISKNAEKAVETQVEKSAEKESTKQVEKPIEKKQDLLIVDEPKKTTKKDTKKSTTIASKPPVSKKTTIEKPKKSIPANIEKDIAVIDEPKKETKIIEPKKETKPTTALPTNEQNNKPATSSLKDLGGEGEYVVQIYSSPSKEDAEIWLRKLQQKSGEGFISTQKIRDKIYYRVRFGNFKTKEEARSAAIRFGFTQSWIDRIK